METSLFPRFRVTLAQLARRVGQRLGDRLRRCLTRSTARAISGSQGRFERQAHVKA
jgi:hypothetical protein